MMAPTRWSGETRFPTQVGSSSARRDAPGFDGGPTWSPDGSRLAFSSERDGVFGIYVMDAGGDGVQHIGDAETEAWSYGGVANSCSAAAMKRSRFASGRLKNVGLGMV